MSPVNSCIKCLVWWCIYVQVFTNNISVLFCHSCNSRVRTQLHPC